jgi:hypothetical protein
MASTVDRVGKGLRKSAKDNPIKDGPPKKQVGPAEDKVHKGRLRSKTVTAGNSASHNSDSLLREGKSGSAPSTKQRVNDMLGKSQKGYLNRVKHARTADAAAKAGGTTARMGGLAKQAGAAVARAVPHPAAKIAGGLAYAAGVAASGKKDEKANTNTRGAAKKRKGK